MFSQSSRTFALLVTLAVSVLLAFEIACAPNAPVRVEQTDTSSPRPRQEFADALGRRLEIIHPPRRIISLAPNLTEIIFAMGAGDRLAGVTSYCDYPPAARDKEKVGDTIQPNIERIIALKPDLVLVSTSSQLEHLTTRLDQLSIPVYVTNPRTVQDVIASIRRIGEVLGSQEAAGALAGEMQTRIESIQKQVESSRRVRVLYALQTGPLIVPGRNTFINDLLKLAGADSISSSETADYPQFSLESVIARAPEAIIVQDTHGAGGPSDAELKRLFAVTPAIRNNRIIRVNPDLITRPGPRIVEGLEMLANALHPNK